jgi:hypothetical protein
MHLLLLKVMNFNCSASTCVVEIGVLGL